MRVLAISGSRLRTASHNTARLRAAADLAPTDVEVEIFTGLDSLPPYNEDLDTDQPPAEVRRLREQIASADAVLFAAPEYDGTMPGQLEHAVDWASRPYGRERPLWGKPAAVIVGELVEHRRTLAEAA